MKFVMFGAWTQTFLPMAAILNYAMYSNLDSFSHQVFMANLGALGTGTIDVLYDHAVRVHTVLAEMVGFIPLISLAIITGSMHAWTHVARGVGQTMDSVTKDNAARDVGGMEGTAALAGMLPGTTSRMTYHAASSFTAEGLAGGGTFAEQDRHINQAKVSVGSMLKNELANKKAISDKWSQTAQNTIDKAAMAATRTTDTKSAYNEIGRRVSEEQSDTASMIRGITDQVGESAKLSTTEKQEFAGRLQAGLAAGLDMEAAIKGALVGARVGAVIGGPVGAVVGAGAGALASTMLPAGPQKNGSMQGQGNASVGRTASAGKAEVHSLDKSSLESLTKQYGTQWSKTQSDFKTNGTRSESATTREVGTQFSDRDQQTIAFANEAAREVAVLESATRDYKGQYDGYSGDHAKRLFNNERIRNEVLGRLNSDGDFAKGAAPHIQGMADYTGDFRRFAGAVQYMALNEESKFLNYLSQEIGIGGNIHAPTGDTQDVKTTVDGRMEDGKELGKSVDDRLKNPPPAKPAPAATPPAKNGTAGKGRAAAQPSQTPKEKMEAAAAAGNQPPLGSGVKPQRFTQSEQDKIEKIHDESQGRVISNTFNPRKW